MLEIEQQPSGPSDRYLLPGPAVPISATAYDGTAFFDGESVRLEWNWAAARRKRQQGPQNFPLHEISLVEWGPGSDVGYGYLRFRIKGATPASAPERDPHSLMHWAVKKDHDSTVLFAAAVTARLPHPSASSTPSAPQPAALEAASSAPSAPQPAALEAAPSAVGDRSEALMRRLRELGELHRDGVLTDEEFTEFKRELLNGFRAGHTTP
ncbi:DUF4429 domain-containing protein [Sinosporangium siamense]|uniref:DUF4429 domain-containing protein n=1 Tax=Sinosporangium siamense TaxID=1367973 RepID=A0A919V9A2_9ACTN|nr:DUF4429 domain-containing protein [Sinosporangium siamense]GII96990.1 hypothetical protein Ssi02_72210 [Sinosporangium siamense]